MPQGITPKKGKKNAKFGRNAAKCQAYRARVTTNKLTKLRRHLHAHPNGACALKARHCLLNLPKDK